MALNTDGSPQAPRRRSRFYRKIGRPIQFTPEEIQDLFEESNKTSNKVSGGGDEKMTLEEFAEQLRKGLRGEIVLRLAGPNLSWNLVYAGNVTFIFGDWHFVFYNDCGSLDYIDSVITPDGKISTVDDWGESCPTDFLSRKEFYALEKLLEETV